MARLTQVKDVYEKLLNKPRPPEQTAGHFNLFRLEDLYIPDTPPEYSRRDFFKISFVEGNSIIHYAHRSVEISGYTLVFTNPMLPYQWERISNKQRGYVCIFTAGFISHLPVVKDYPVFSNPHQAIIPLAEGEAELYEAIFKRMHTELETDYTFKYDLLRGLLLQLIHDTQKKYRVKMTMSSESGSHERITALFTELLDRQFPIDESNPVLQIHTPSAFAQQLHIHVNHLNKSLKNTTGQTTSQLISNRIMDEAKILLGNHHLPVNEIARSLCFAEPNHFSSFFKSRAGVSPSQFRKL